jgi:multicomponent Na+:H+ antiporter subunit F
MTDIILIVVGVLLAVAAGASVYRIVRGPAILDRMIASDMLVTTLILVLGAEMVVHDHTRTIPIMIVLAVTAVFASMSVARYVSKQGGGKPTMPVGRKSKKTKGAGTP